MIEVEAPTLGFSGMRLFYITKSTILLMIGKIITFEIILLDEIHEEETGLCSIID